MREAGLRENETGKMRENMREFSRILPTCVESCVSLDNKLW